MLLRTEEEQYTTEMAGRQETALERQAKMRERAKMLRERREAERLALVEKKLDQRWRYVLKQRYLRQPHLIPPLRKK